MKSVLILSNSYKPNIGGIETYIENLLDILEKSGYYTYLLTFKQATYAKNFNVKKLPSKAFEKRKMHEIRRYNFIDFDFNTIIKSNLVRDMFSFFNLFFHSFLFLMKYKNKVSIIHAQDTTTAAIAYLLSKMFKKKWVVTFHNVYKLSKRGIRGVLGRIILKQCPCIFAASKPIMKSLTEDLRDSLPRIILSKYWVNTKLFKPESKLISRKKLKLPEKAFIALFVGRITEGKGISKIIEASQISNDIKFVLVGSGDLDNYIRKDQSDNLIFLGPKFGKELVACYNAADVSIFPTTYNYEGFGRVIIESLACDTPVIISNKMPKETVDDKIGRIITVTPKNIIKTINYFRKSNLSKSLENKCRQFVLKNYSESNGIKIINTYKELVG